MYFLVMLNKYFSIEAIINFSSVWKEFLWLQGDLHLLNKTLRGRETLLKDVLMPNFISIVGKINL